MTGPCIFRPLRFSSLNQRALMQISGARTRTHAAGVEQRACRAGPEGVSGVPRIIERSSMESPYCRKQKTSPQAGFFK